MNDLPHLGRQLLASRDSTDATLGLPEKIVQFGTGAFLRGFVDCFVDEANHAGAFNGRIVAVGSTGSGRDRKLNEQNGLYTLAIRGVENGSPRYDYRLITAVSRALSATQEWPAVLACARNPDIEVVFSNTTETGIRLDKTDKLGPGAPRSFPGKLTAFLLERARHFDYSRERGVVVLPCELIDDNGAVLEKIVLELARQWSLGSEFEDWIGDAVTFCNTLVDRIVPGELDPAEAEVAWNELGYRDELLTVCEPYRLYAIQANESVAARLGFVAAHPDIVITNDIAPFSQRKVRLLNGTHTITAPAALLAGCSSVAEVMRDELLAAFVRRALFAELVTSANRDDADAFASQVIDRFSNPYVRHALLDITLQQTAKMRVRIVPAVLDYVTRTGTVPDSLALGFAAFLLYVREANGHGRPDEHSEAILTAWRTARNQPRVVANLVCEDRALWGEALSLVPGFAQRAGDHLQSLVDTGVRATLDQHLAIPQRA